MSSTQQKLKYVATINDEALGEDTDSDFEMQYVDISSVDSSGSIGVATYRFEEAPSRARRRVRDGDIIISTVRTYLQAIAQVQDPPENLIVSTGFAVVRPRREVFDARYCKYALREPEFLAEVERRSVGVSYPAINASDLGDIPVHIHPLSRQRAIADYLDCEAARIDALVAAKERVVGLLAEKRRAVITRAVTRGLDARAPLRDSGLPWLGEIPVHWAVVPLMYLTDRARPIMYGIVLPGPDVGEGIPIVKGGNVRPDRMNRASLARTTPEIEAPYARARLRANDLVYSIRGSIGDCEPVPAALEGCNITQDVARVAPSPAINASWLRYALLSDPIREELASGSVGAAVRGINIFDLKRVRIPLPPAAEQLSLASYLASDLRKLDDLTAATERTIALSRERRSALIAAAVTGQIATEAAT